MPASSAEPASWVAVSLGLYLLWAVMARQFGRRWSDGLANRFPSTVAAAGAQLASLAYYVGFPYLALISGGLDLRTLGLVGSDPLNWLPPAALMAFSAWALLAASWRRWVNTGAAPAPVTAEADGTGNLAAWSLAGAVTLQCHLALYRGAITLAAGAYAGTYAGLGLVLLERLAGAVLRRKWPGDGAPESEILLLATLAVTSLLFLTTGSLLACLLAHLAIEFGLGWVTRRYVAPSAEE